LDTLIKFIKIFAFLQTQGGKYLLVKGVYLLCVDKSILTVRTVNCVDLENDEVTNIKSKTHTSSFLSGEEDKVK